MSHVIIYLDESGDLGWNFDHKYRYGGSSRHMTIAAALVPFNKQKLIRRLIRDLYTKFKWESEKEKKWTRMTKEERECFSTSALRLIKAHSDIKYFSITVYKPNVLPHIRNDSNKLYNYMIALMLNHHMAKYQLIEFAYDRRSLKVQSGNSLYDYLVTDLWFKHNATTEVNNCPMDSCNDKGIQFADMLSGMIQHHYEDNKSDPYQILNGFITQKRLFH